jgi:hypothetical protein
MTASHELKFRAGLNEAHNGLDAARPHAPTIAISARVGALLKEIRAILDSLEPAHVGNAIRERFGLPAREDI